MMADRFIDQLNELTDPATGDWLVIEDVSAGETKKIHPGTATFRDVQTSPTDTTAGRLMAVGAGGLLGVTNLGAADDYNAALNVSRMVAHNTSASTPANAPVAAGVAGVQVMSSASRGAQLAIASQNSVSLGNRAWIRGKDTTWANWSELYHTNNLLGTVSQSGGVPTGAVMEAGSNSNGRFTRFANGWQICTRTFTGIDITTSEAGLFRSASFTWTFPAAFIDRPEGLTGTIFNYAAGLSVHLAGGAAGNSNAIRAYGTASSSGRDIVVTAIGRWANL